MAKLTDTQLVLLSAAAERDGGAVLPPLKSLKTNKAAIARNLKSLINRGLIIEQPATKEDELWRKAEDGGRLKLVITDVGLEAIGAEVDVAAAVQPAAAKAQPNKRKPWNRQAATSHQTKSEAPPANARQGTKQHLLIDLLKRKDGATIAEFVEATGWQPHSVRGAISGTLKKKLGLRVTSEPAEDRGRVYRIVDA